MLKLVCRRTQNLTPLLSRRNKIDQLFIRNPMTTGLIMQTLIYVISMELVSVAEEQMSLLAPRPLR